MMDAIRHGLSNYVNFSGRTDRATFWWWVLAVFLLMVVLSLIDNVVLGAGEAGSVGILSAIATLGLFLPGLAISVRRLHDIGKSGWWILIGLVPIVGFFVLLYFYVQPSQSAAAATA